MGPVSTWKMSSREPAGCASSRPCVRAMVYLQNQVTFSSASSVHISRKSLHIDEPAACSPEFLVLRPEPHVDTRYLAYVVQSDAFIDAAVAFDRWREDASDLV